MKQYDITVQQLLNILDRVKLPEVTEIEGTPTTIKIDQSQELHNIRLELINSGDPVESQTEIAEQRESSKSEFKPGLHELSKKINHVYRDITPTHGKLSAIVEHLDEKTFQIVINTGTIKYQKMSKSKENLAWHVSECIIKSLALHTGDPADHKRIDELIDLFYDRLDGVIDNK